MFSFAQWTEYFHSVKDRNRSIHLRYASVNGSFYLSPHENILSIALINIHYLYINQYVLDIHTPVYITPRLTYYSSRLTYSSSPVDFNNHSSEF